MHKTLQIKLVEREHLEDRGQDCIKYQDGNVAIESSMIYRLLCPFSSLLAISLVQRATVQTVFLVFEIVFFRKLYYQISDFFQQQTWKSS